MFLSEKNLIYSQMDLEHRLVSDNLFENKNKEKFESYSKIIIYKTEDSIFRFYRKDLSANIISKINSLSFDFICQNTDKIANLLDLDNQTWHGLSYVFDHLPFEPLHDVKFRGNEFIILNDETIVSRAFSAWENEQAAEPIVETDELFRRNGYATSVILAWAKHQLQNNKIPFYSHILTNTSSQNLAIKLKLRLFCETISFGIYP